ncbi:MAG: transposase, partial [Desulfobacterales bacterium]
MELAGYIHLSPLRVKLVKAPSDLDTYPHAGNRVLMGKESHPWQDTAHVLSCFGRTAKAARRKGHGK